MRQADPLALPPLISVVMCTCNGQPFIAEQLDSLFAQDDPNFEIVVCDDASTDGTYDYLQSRADPKLRLYRNAERLGFNGNFGRAFGLARGVLIAPCDQDDYWQPAKLSRLRQALGGSALVYSDSALVDAAGGPTGRRLSEKFRFYRGRDPLAFAFDNSVSGHAMLFRRELLALALPVPEAAAYYDWWIAAIAAANGGVEFVMEPLVSYRLHEHMQSGLVFDRATSSIEWLQRRSAFLLALSERLPADHSAKVKALADHLRCRLHRAFCPGLARFVWDHGDTLFHVNGGLRGRRLRRALDHLFGIPVKRLFRPGKYPPAPRP